MVPALPVVSGRCLGLGPDHDLEIESGEQLEQGFDPAPLGMGLEARDRLGEQADPRGRVLLREAERGAAAAED